MNLIIRILNKLFCILNNIFLNKKYMLSYIVEGKDWAVNQVGEEIVNYLNRSELIKARITVSHFGLKNQIIHFGSINTFLNRIGACKPHKSNKIVVTWFHIIPNDPRIKFIKEVQKYINLFHTSCNISKNELIKIGIPQEKIVVIPIGVDLSLFKPVSIKEKQKIKKAFGIPLDKIIIGSFQKDGVGWNKGLEPKLIKGPDIFINVVEKLAKSYPLFVLLVGPARGYVEIELQKKDIPFKNIGFVENLEKVVEYYNALDLYLITSRIEGGPKQILEAWASGIPVVSAKVGMVPDISIDGKNILLAEVENINEIVQKAKIIIEDKGLREKLIKNGLEIVQNYSWDKIVQRYYKEIYSKLL